MSKRKCSHRRRRPLTAFDEYETICPFCHTELYVSTVWWMDGEKRGPTLDFDPAMRVSDFQEELEGGEYAGMVERYGMPDEVDVSCLYCDDHYTLEDLRVAYH